MPTRDRSLLGIGDERAPEPPPSAARYAVRTVAERDDELADFRRRYAWLHGLAVRLTDEDTADDVVADALARCLLRRPLARWDDDDVEHAILLVAEELTARPPARLRRAPIGTRAVDPDARAAKVLADAHQRLATGRARGPVAPPEHRRGRLAVAVALVVAVAAALIVTGLATTPTDRSAGGPRIAYQVRSQLQPMLVSAGTVAPDPLRFWNEYNLRFTKMPGIEVPVGAYVDANREHVGRALLGEVYTIAAEPGGPPIGYHHQLLGYLPVWIVEQPGFEWVDFFARHNECAPGCLPVAPSLPTSA